jgi:lipid II:glycine glycyltransferase (peptidoglycan interpeptide bridge formation enzyme)
VVREAYRAKQPLTRLIFESMVDASVRGFARWNWGGTWATQDGLYLFKSRWGTRDVKYTYYVQINTDAIRACSPQFLLTHYANFFVIPFQQLRASS